MSTFVQVTCPLCRKSTHPTEENFTKNFDNLGQYRVVKSEGYDGFKVLSSERLIDVIDEDEEAKKSFEIVRKSIIGAFSRLYELGFLDIPKDLPVELKKKIKKRTKRMETQEQEITDLKNRLKSQKKKQDYATVTQADMKKLERKIQRYEETIDQKNQEIRKLEKKIRKLQDYLEMS